MRAGWFATRTPAGKLLTSQWLEFRGQPEAAVEVLDEAPKLRCDPLHRTRLLHRNGRLEAAAAAFAECQLELRHIDRLRTRNEPDFVLSRASVGATMPHGERARNPVALLELGSLGGAPAVVRRAANDLLAMGKHAISKERSDELAAVSAALAISPPPNRPNPGWGDPETYPPQPPQPPKPLPRDPGARRRHRRRAAAVRACPKSGRDRFAFGHAGCASRFLSMAAVRGRGVPHRPVNGHWHFGRAAEGALDDEVIICVSKQSHINDSQLAASRIGSRRNEIQTTSVSARHQPPCRGRWERDVPAIGRLRRSTGRFNHPLDPR